MVTEDASLLLQVSESYNYISEPNFELHLQLKDLEKEIWCFIYLTSAKNFLLVMNENLKGKVLKRVHEKALTIIDSDYTFLDYKIYIIQQYDL